MKVAYVRNTDSVKAAQLCADQISREPNRPKLAVAFCGGKHSARDILKTLREILGGFPVVGGSAAGCISRRGFGYSGFELVIAFFFDGDPIPEYVSTHGLEASEKEAGRSLGRRVREMVGNSGRRAVVALLYDSVAGNPPLRLHPAADLVEGFYSGLGERPVHLVGGGLLTDMNLSSGWVYDGESVSRHAAFALVFPPQVRAETVIMHGCRPVSAFMEITRIDGAEIFELDHLPALGVLDEMIGTSNRNARSPELSLLATLGKKHGDPYASFDENNYVNRLILAGNPDSGSITIFEPDFELGSQVQIMARDNKLMLDSVRTGSRQLASQMRDKNVFLNIYIDCAGRASARSGAHVEEAEIALAESDGLEPFFGFYSGVEIAPVSGKSRPLDWTAVLTSLYVE